MPPQILGLDDQARAARLALAIAARTFLALCVGGK
ncbi:hypothetical protein LAUMK7_05319 [Mycobacterium kansasii]|uniref:Uncharacterized protein n=1 Tax=Mycobacterium kansasii TaxID=1768 RepID=A0A653EKK1_MYCKA|nr:hypothetical protein MKANGN_21520 [Mycobacterium kansasii]VAZ62862.1 hypothetical protein LAUMK22_04691 [Mycobacterium kansasii]VAZ69281.1 hypothetical protein LAUMK40_05442 [Mycobacterium kansasii]VAZ80384.1 hypothetical protein LAUMK7_05319 [Mycobacterium kansasii]VTO98006.1 hypothetical protein BIN_B_01160 [Mycobacterium kansasii]